MWPRPSTAASTGRPKPSTHDHEWVPYGINFITVTPRLGRRLDRRIRDPGRRRTWRRVAMGLSTNKIRFVPRPNGRIAAYALGHDLYRLELTDPR